MDKNNTISLQEVRKDPLGFLDQVNKGKIITVIYHSKPLVTVMSADSKVYGQTKSIKRMLQYADLANKSAKKSTDSSKSYKEIYAEDMAKKYGVS
jgi:antitoxin (DNA-binding transcriptional repressor) of toxin-antitoxin stability system